MNEAQKTEQARQERLKQLSEMPQEGLTGYFSELYQDLRVQYGERAAGAAVNRLKKDVKVFGGNT